MFPPASPFLTAGAGSTIPISAGGGTSGDTSTAIGPISVGGLFGSDAMGNSVSPQTLLIVGAAVLIGFVLLKKL